MKKYAILFVAIALMAFVPNRLEPTKITWETLRDVTFKKKWYPEESVFMLYPTFGPNVNKLSGKEVTITGYVLPVDIESNLYVLSAFPMAACFFAAVLAPKQSWD